MIFYKIDLELDGPVENVDKNEREERAKIIQSKVNMLFEKSEYSCHITATDIHYKKQKGILCAALRSGVLTDKAVSEFLVEIDLCVRIFSIQEITLEIYFNLLNTAFQNEFVGDNDNVTDRLKITNLNTHNYFNDISYTETIINVTSGHKKLLNDSKMLLCDTDFSVELERIFHCVGKGAASGHPVHYLVLSDDRIVRGKMLKILLSALYQNDRIKSRRYCEVSFDCDSNVPDSALDTLYESCSGGTVVVTYAQDNLHDSEYSRIGVDNIDKICSAMRKVKNKVLTVFCLAKSSPAVKETFLEHLGSVTVVSLCEEASFGEKAKAYLRNLAKEQGIRPDKALYKPIKEGRSYTSVNLNVIFDEWHDRQLKTKIYTQYAGLESASKNAALRKPIGSAFEELSGMIGLNEAKVVIQRALDYYKAQKLFRDKGFATERPAIHMVFSGNPGTAKTSVARLFAQIMKDNDLLSVGDLHEVGRADLVGKYVGWTASIVKQKFKSAKGSVLFIDEAYSLVDDRDGLYGDEAINTIVQEMENCREDMVVIFAGYPDKMDGFLRKNPGLRSRIAFHVPFADYNADELCKITELLAAGKKKTLGEDVRAKLLPIYENAVKTANFENGRFARNLVEQAVMKQASRLLAMDYDMMDSDDIELLLADDFEAPVIEFPTTKKIGFAV